MMDIGGAIALCATIALAACQIYYPTDELELALTQNRNKEQFPQTYNNTISRNSLSVPNSIAKLALDVNRVAPKLRQQEPNLAFSPTSIAGVLALVLLGSIGQTFNEIVNFMGFNEGYNVQNDNIEVHRQLSRILNAVERSASSNNVVLYKSAIFVQEDYLIRKEYQQAAEYFYRSSVISLNFRSNPSIARSYINSWVSNSTNRIIPTLLDDVPDRNTRAIITSTLYFKGAWDKPFIRGGSNWKPFYTNGRGTKSERMAMLMYNGGEFPYYKDKDLNIEILGLPYKGETTMYVILPQDSNVGKLRQLENYLTPADLGRLINSTRLTEVVVAFPKMKLENTLNLAQTMRNLGVNSLFDPRSSNLALLTPGFLSRFGGVFERPSTTPQPQFNRRNQLVFSQFNQDRNCQRMYDYQTNTFRCKNEARRTRAAEFEFLEKLQNEYRQFNLNPRQANPGLYADEFIHKTIIDITEEGTEAAAVSGIGINRSGGKVTFRCDVPFLFFIHQSNTGMILFWGSVTSPVPGVPSDASNSKQM